MHCYCSPFGGKIQGLLEERDDALDLQVIQGTLTRHELPDDHPLCAHVRGPDPTNLEGWHDTPDGLIFRQPGFIASAAQVAPHNVVAIMAQNARMERELKDLRQLIEQSLAMPGRVKPGSGKPPAPPEG